MPTWYEFKFMPEGRVQRWFGTRGNCYRLADGCEIDLHTTPVWCAQCVSITDGEKIESLATIDKDLADLRDPASFSYQMWTNNAVHEVLGGGDKLREGHVEALKLRRQWRESRTSPPRCIECGSTEILPFPENEAVNNPAGPGTVTMSAVGHVSTGWTGWVFTPEGERIHDAQQYGEGE
jgi:hypothetical protein